MNNEDVCYVRKREFIKKKEIRVLFGDVIQKREKTKAFIIQRKTDVPIPISELEKYEAALFQHHHNNDEWPEYLLEDILVDYEIKADRGEVTAKKLFYHMGKYELETRTYYLGNYGKTWRAWKALPTEEAARKWD